MNLHKPSTENCLRQEDRDIFSSSFVCSKRRTFRAAFAIDSGSACPRHPGKHSRQITGIIADFPASFCTDMEKVVSGPTESTEPGYSIDSLQCD
jgi:hypothetical protein